MKLILRPCPEVVWAFSFGKWINGTKGENKLAIRTKQVHAMHSLPEMVQILKSLLSEFLAFHHAKVEMLKFTSCNKRDYEHRCKCMNIKCMDRGAVVVQLRRHKWLGL
ncbi:hypothetical protein N8Z70_04215 [Candidatus Puniceispirillum sp.]|nr:hypothetical protein [Alphaproteobacteria bacterium]MDC1294224.1 hypothetical protein [Candidatus Puniceispirillum sp.]